MLCNGGNAEIPSGAEGLTSRKAWLAVGVTLSRELNLSQREGVIASSRAMFLVNATLYPKPMM